MRFQADQQVEVTAITVGSSRTLTAQPDPLPFRDPRRNLDFHGTDGRNPPMSPALRARRAHSKSTAGIRRHASPITRGTDIFNRQPQVLRCPPLGLFQRQVDSVLDIFAAVGHVRLPPAPLAEDTFEEISEVDSGPAAAATIELE